MTAAVASDARPTEPEAPRAFGPWSRELLSFAELFAISGLAFAQPAFDILSKNVTLLVTRRTEPWQVVALTIAFLFGPPAFAFAIELVSGLLGARVRRWCHVVLVGVGAAVVVEEAVKHASDLGPAPLVVIGVLAGIGVALLVRYFDIARTFLRFLAIAPVIFGISFLGFSPASKTVFLDEPPSASGATIGAPHRVVEIVMDEFPLGTLLDGSGKVDADLYPNFAALAATSTWYRNTTSVSPYTEWAVPAIATGQYPTTAEDLAVAADHPDSIFRLLGGAYRMNVHESVTDLCPDKFCPQTHASGSGVRNLAATMRDAAKLWREFASPERSEAPDFTPPPGIPEPLRQTQQFLASLTPGTERIFDYLHVMVPHQPWHLLPTMQDAGYIADDLSTKANLLVWQDDWSARIGRERHILQAMAADTALGRIMKRLQRIGAWNDSVVVVTADHGVSFATGEPHRSFAVDNADELLWVPLFVKGSGQVAGKADDRPMETIDIVPTIAAQLDLKIPWDIDGVAGTGKPRPEFDRRLYQWKLDHLQPPISKIAPDGEALMFDAVSGWKRVMARQAAAPVGDPALRPYRIGDYGALIGEEAAPLVRDDPEGPSKMFVLDPTVFDAVDPSAPIVPWTRIQGSMLDLRSGRPLAFAVNGVVAGFAYANPYRGQTTGYYWASLVPQLFRPGANELTAYAISGPADRPVLDPIPIDRGGSPSAP